jgi:predicted translin family RNA/ssDNA-binding protein
MADDFAYPDYVVEILAELRELKKEVAKLQREVAELSKKVAQPPQPQQQPANIEAVLDAVREAVEKLNSAALSVVENASLVRAAVAEDRAKRDEACMALLERLMALQDTLKKAAQ